MEGFAEVLAGIQEDDGGVEINLGGHVEEDAAIDAKGADEGDVVAELIEGSAEAILRRETAKRVGAAYPPLILAGWSGVENGGLGRGFVSVAALVGGGESVECAMPVGLGLAIIRVAVDEHGGEAALEGEGILIGYERASCDELASVSVSLAKLAGDGEAAAIGEGREVDEHGFERGEPWRERVEIDRIGEQCGVAVIATEPVFERGDGIETMAVTGAAVLNKEMRLIARHKAPL